MIKLKNRYSRWEDFNFGDIFFSDFDIFAIGLDSNFQLDNIRQPCVLVFVHNSNDINSNLVKSKILVSDLKSLKILKVFFVYPHTNPFDLQYFFTNTMTLKYGKMCQRSITQREEIWVHGAKCRCELAFQNSLTYKTVISPKKNRDLIGVPPIDIFLPPLNFKSGGAVAIKRFINLSVKSGLNFNFRFYGYDSNYKVNNLGIPNATSNVSRGDSPSISLSFDTVTSLPRNYDFNLKWELNFPGLLPFHNLGQSNPKIDRVFKYSSMFGQNDSRLFINNIDFNLFSQNIDMIKDLRLLYFGKNENKVDLPFLYRTVEELRIDFVITRDWPKSKFELAQILKRSDILYSFDAISAINLEASLCGCRVVINNKFDLNITEKLMSQHDVPLKNVYWDEAALQEINVDENISHNLYLRKLISNIEFNDFRNFLQFMKTLS